MKLNNLIEELRFDKRIIEWGVRYNIITYQDYQKHLQSLSDLSDEKESMVDIKQVEQVGKQDGSEKTEQPN